ncbi:hypothetical protein DN439_01105 [Lactobacillus reuteri]|uniref:hypothetical protein n=1 Tax=Limosilactobacillus reuteri TaxID=1598 RepID=UPI00128E8BC7|nr:hypothetical protein [Limosilactobacillus reuteri]MQB72250.1 hypothetical protein [Limosilactobacillus reuteri]
MADYAKRQLKALDRIAKKIADAEGHLTKIEDSVDNEKHRTAQHETIKDIKSILKHAWKVDKDSVKLEERASEGRKDPAENHYVYMEDEEGVIKDLNKEFKELDEKLAALTDDEGGKIKAFRAEHHYLEKAKKILQNAGKYNLDDKN